VSKLEDPQWSVRDGGLRADRLAHLTHREVSALITGSAHDLNEPLGALGMLVCAGQDLLKRAGDSETPRFAELLSKLESQTTRACEIARRFCETVRRTEPRRAPCDVNFLVAQAVEQVSEQIRAVRADVRLNLHASAAEGQRLDVGQMRQVISSLLQNAVDAFDSSLTVDRILELSTRIDEHHNLILEVRDNGRGISRDLEASLFHPFITIIRFRLLTRHASCSICDCRFWMDSRSWSNWEQDNASCRQLSSRAMEISTAVRAMQLGQWPS
jgi:C4-dicarboxylate-specific signal transduction histidine kinase